MAIGAYRHRLGVFNHGPTFPNGDGGFTRVYTAATPAEVDGSLEAATVRDLERAVAGTVVGTATHLIRCRYHPQITIETRLTFQGRTFEVQSVRNVDERDITLVVICAELLAVAAPAAENQTTARPPRRAPTSAGWA